MVQHSELMKDYNIKQKSVQFIVSPPRPMSQAQARQPQLSIMHPPVSVFVSRDVWKFRNLR